jgi:hypothetical protein
MSESLDKIKKYRKQILTELYNQCTESQQTKFNLLYGSLETISEDKIDLAIQVCERTVKSNNSCI